MKYVFLIMLITAWTASSSTSKSKLETDINFSDLMVSGKYQTADEANARVEDDKGLSDLLQPRKHFKDRLNSTAGRN